MVNDQLLMVSSIHEKSPISAVISQRSGDIPRALAIRRIEELHPYCGSKLRNTFFR